MAKSTNKYLTIFLISLLIISTQSIVYATERSSDIKWIVTGSSPLIDRSSMYMANGYTESGIKYAVKALNRSQHPYTALIASHNLCIA